MKKITTVLVLLMVSLGIVGCGNSQDGDKQRVSAPVVSPSL